MRDPLGPIPSPHAPTPRATRFWSRATAPPPLPRQRQAEPRSELPTSDGFDPLRLLRGRGDMLGIDRRSSLRDRVDESDGLMPAARANSVTAAGHQRVNELIGLRTRHGWALVRAISICDEGLLVRLFDLMDPSLPPGDRTRGRSVFARLAATLGSPVPRRGAGDGVPSPLAIVGGCVLAERVVADLASWASGRPGRPSSKGGRSIGVTLVVPTVHGRTPRATLVQIPGELAPLTDPKPDLLAVSLSSAARSRLELALRPRQRAPTR